MAIDEIEGETCDVTNTTSNIVIAPDYNQLDEGAKFVKSTFAEGGEDVINYIAEDDDEDIVFLESNSPSNTILIILDDDTEQEQIKKGCKSTNFSPAINEIPKKTLLPKNCDLNQTILEEDFDNFCINVLPPLRQYGRKQKKTLPTPEEHNNILPASSTQKSFRQIEDVCEINNENRDLPGLQIQKEQENDGLKPLSEITAIFSNTSSETTNELEGDNVTPVQDKVREMLGLVHSYNDKICMDDEDCIVQSEPEIDQEILEIIDEEECDKADYNSSNGPETSLKMSECNFVCESTKIKNEIEITDIPANSKSCSVGIRCSLSSKCGQYKNSPREDILQIQPFENKAYVEEVSPSSEVDKSEDIQFYLEKIFEANSFNSSDTQSSPVVVKMKDNPIIISENGLVTVIYKPEKVKFRREIEISEAEKPRKRPFDENINGPTKVSKRKEKCSSGRIQKMQISNEQTQPNQEITYLENNLTKMNNGHPRVSDVKKLQRTGIRWTKKKYPPLRKVKYKGEMVYKCKDCDFVHPDCVAAVRRHMIRHQPAESIDWFYCDLCNYRAKRKGNLKIHMILHRNPDDVVWYKCEMCDKKFKHRNGLYSHEKRHIKRDEIELYLCDQCSYKTPFKHTLLRHKMNHESVQNKKLLICNICSYSTYNKYYLSRHKKHTHREPMYKCLLCNYEAKFKANLESHLKRHFPQEEVFYCDSCSFSTNRRYTLTLHNRHVHNIYSSPENQMFFCYNCSYQTRFKRCLVKHMSIHSGIQVNQEMHVEVKTEVTMD